MRNGSLFVSLSNGMDNEFPVYLYRIFLNIPCQTDFQSNIYISMEDEKHLDLL